MNFRWNSERIVSLIKPFSCRMEKRGREGGGWTVGGGRKGERVRWESRVRRERRGKGSSGS